MYYTVELNTLNKNKVGLKYYKITKNSKISVSKQQYDNYFKRIYTNNKKQNGGMIDLNKFKKNPTYSVNPYNKYNGAGDNDLNPNQINIENYSNDTIMNIYEHSHQYLVTGLG